MPTPIDNGLVQIGRKGLLTLREAGAQLSNREFAQQLRRIGTEAAEDTVQFFHQAPTKKLNILQRTSLRIRNFLNKLLGKYTKIFKESGEEVAEQSATQAASIASTNSAVRAVTPAEASIGAIHNRQVEKLRAALGG